MLHRCTAALYSGDVDAITLTDLLAVVAAVLGPTLAAVVALARYQHKDSIETHRLIVEVRDEARTLNGEARDEFRTGIADARDEFRTGIADARDEFRTGIAEARDEFRTGIADARDETRQLFDKASDLISEHRRENGEDLKEVIRSLADARERLARIEGHFGIGGSPRDEDGRGTADAA